MSRPVKHFSLHRSAAAELRVVADVEEGVLALIQVEEAVIRAYARQGHWPHRWVTLFILEDLLPLVRQLRLGISPTNLGAAGYSLSPESIAALSGRALVNVFDLADLSSCNVFVNRQAMMAEGYWEDLLAAQGLFAHEHAHPLAENETTRASRTLRLQIEDKNPRLKIIPTLTSLAEKLCLLAPREVFTNELAIQSGFAEALLHLNLRNVNNTVGALAGRETLVRQLQQETVQGKLTALEANLLLLVGDLNSHLPLTLEVAPFYRAGRASDAQTLESILQSAVFPALDPLTPQLFTELREKYIALSPGLSPADLLAWSAQVMDILVKALAERGLPLRIRLWTELAKGETDE